MLIKKIATLFKPKITKITPADWAIAMAGVAVFAAIALATIGRSSIWFDEAFSAYIIRFNFAEIWQYTSMDVHPPLYYWFLKLWSVVFGNSDIALRSMSVLFGGIAVVFGYLLLRRSFGRTAGIYGLLAIVVSPMLIRYSQEMRMYTMVLAIGLAATYVLTLAVERGGRKLWVLYGVLLALGMWTHYFAAIIWLAHWAWRATVVKRAKKYGTLKKYAKAFFSKEWVLAHCVAVGLFIAWLPFLIKQLVVVQAFGFWIPDVTPVTVMNFFTNAVMYQDQNELSPWLTLAFLVLVPVVVALSVFGYKKLDKRQKVVYLLLAAVAFVPPILLIVSSMPPLQSSFIDRYLVTSSVAITILMGLALWFARNIKNTVIKWSVRVLIIGALVVGVVNVYHYGNYNKISKSTSSAMQMMQKVSNDPENDLPVVASDVWSYYDTVAYATQQNPVYFVDIEKYEYGSLEMLRTRDLNKIKDFNEFLNTHSSFWYVGNSGDTKLELTNARVHEEKRLQVQSPIVNKPGYQAVLYSVSAE